MVKVEDNLVNIYFDAFTKALTLVVALAWNNAFTEYFKNNPSLKALGPWLYAFFITALVVFLMIALAKLRVKVQLWYGKLKKQIQANIGNEEEVEEVEEVEEEPESFDDFKTKNIDYTQF
tara:strand:+ start:973 stop:1332 length:360 start_codon:yes stop_codon:yes gene_type:complete